MCRAVFGCTRGLQVVASGLNLSNEVFGFYNGSPIYPVQREYYKSDAVVRTAVVCEQRIRARYRISARARTYSVGAGRIRFPAVAFSRSRPSGFLKLNSVLSVCRGTIPPTMGPCVIFQEGAENAIISCCCLQLFSCYVLTVGLVQAQSGWKVSKTLHVGGEGGWDYVTVDPAKPSLCSSLAPLTR